MQCSVVQSLVCVSEAGRQLSLRFKFALVQCVTSSLGMCDCVLAKLRRFVTAPIVFWFMCMSFNAKYVMNHLACGGLGSRVLNFPSFSYVSVSGKLRVCMCVRVRTCVRARVSV